MKRRVGFLPVLVRTVTAILLLTGFVLFSGIGTSQTAKANLAIPGAPINPTTIVNAATSNGTVPAVPSNLTADRISDNRIDLSWTDNSDSEIGFHIETAINSAFTGSIEITVPANVTAYTDNTTYAGETFYYRVTAFNAGGDSAFSNVASVYIPPPTATVPDAPSNLRVVAVDGNKIDIAWNDNSLNEVGFQIEHDKDSSFSNAVSAIAAVDVTTFTDTVIANGTYYYRVKAFNAIAPSPESNIVSVTISGGSKPVNISGLSATNDLIVDSEGHVMLTIELENTDKDCILKIFKGTKVLDASGQALSQLSYARVAPPSAAPQGKVILSAHEFGPDGAAFSPEIGLAIKYNPAALPAGTSTQAMVIAFWDGASWQILPSTVDIIANKVIANVSHFTSFGLLASEAVSTPPTPAKPTTPTTPTTPATPATPTTPALPTTPTTPTIPTTPTQTPESQPSAPSVGFNWWIIVAIVGAILVIGSLVFVLRNRGKKEVS